jgi:hypothetical protein
MKPKSIITEQQLIQLLMESRQSASFGGLTITTDARSSYLVNCKADGTKFPYKKGELIKEARMELNLNVMYADAMNRALDGEYEAGKSWFYHLKFPNGKTAKNILVSKKSGDLYLGYIADFTKYKVTLYEANGGKEISQESLAKFKAERTSDKEVPFLTTKLANVKSIRINGQEYEVIR